MAMSQCPQMIDKVVVVVKVVKINRLIIAKDLAIQASINLVPVVFVQVLACCIEVQRAKTNIYAFFTQQQSYASR